MRSLSPEVSDRFGSILLKKSKLPLVPPRMTESILVRAMSKAGLERNGTIG